MPRAAMTTRRSALRRWLILTVVVGATTWTAACSTDEPEVAPGDPCRATIDQASAEAEISRQVELLDQALLICPSVEAFAVNAQRHPTLFGWDVATYLGTRCTTVEDDAVRRSRICRTGSVTTTTLAPADVLDVVYVGTTLDGREVEIRPSPGRPFDDGIPSVIEAMTDVAIQDGCDGVRAVYESWVVRVDDVLIGDEASVYAQHALDVLAYIQCEL